MNPWAPVVAVLVGTIAGYWIGYHKFRSEQWWTKRFEAYRATLKALLELASMDDRLIDARTPEKGHLEGYKKAAESVIAALGVEVFILPRTARNLVDNYIKWRIERWNAFLNEARGHSAPEKLQRAHVAVFGDLARKTWECITSLQATARNELQPLGSHDAEPF